MARTMARTKKPGATRKAARKKRPRVVNEDRSFDMSVSDGKVQFGSTSDKGNGFTKGKGAFKWTISGRNLEFQLTFRREECQGLGNASDWPFTEDPAPGTSSSTNWVGTFNGKARVFGLYSYTVEVRDTVSQAIVADSDPIIIIGRV